MTYPSGLNLEYADAGVVSIDPGFEYQGQETGALYVETRIIQGAIYNVQNATWNKFAQVWSLVDVTKPANGFLLDASGVFSVITSPSGTTPFTVWTTTGVLSLQRSGTQASVPADGSAAVTISYSSPFPTATSAVVPSIINDYQANPWGLTVQITGVTKTGFTVNVAGAPSGATVSVGYIANGN